MDIQFGTADLDQFSMDYFKFGKGERTLVILPGLNTTSVMPNAEAVSRTYKALADDFTIYLFDRRKGVLPSVYTVKDMAEDTAKAFIKVGLYNVDIFGASQGGMIAMTMAINNPELVHALIIGSSTAKIDKEDFAIFDNWIKLAKEERTEELYLTFAKDLFSAEMLENSRDLWINLSKAVKKEDLERFVILAEGMRGFDITSELKKVTCPVLSLGSNADNLFKKGESEQIVNYLVNSKCSEKYMYDGYGHAVFDCTPDFQKRMLEFLKKHSK